MRSRKNILVIGAMVLLSVFVLTARFFTEYSRPQAGFPADPDGFTRAVAKGLNDAGLPEPARIVAPLTLKAKSVTGSDTQLNLDRIYHTCQADQQSCPGVVEGFVKGFAETLRTVPALTRPEELRAVLRPASYLRNLPASAGIVDVASNSLPEGLAALIYADRPQTMVAIRAADLQRMQLSKEEAYALALRNIATALGPIDDVIRPLAVNRIALSGHDPYESSRLLLHADWAQVSARFGDHLLVAVPSAELLFYADGSDEGTLDALSKLAHDRFAKAERPISPAVYEWRPDRWITVAP